MPKIEDDNSTPLPELDPMPPLPERSDISRRPMLDYFHLPAAGGGLMRMLSDREKLIEGMKTLAWVVPLTLLIWMYAVREQVVQSNSPNVQFVPARIESSDPNLYVEFSEPGDHTVNLQLTGPQQAFEQVKEKLTTDIPRGFTINLGSSLSVGNNQPVDITDHIQNLSIFKDNGVTVQQSVPAALSVNVYRKIQRDVDIAVPPALVSSLSPETRFEPAKVTVSGPEALVNQVVAGDIKVCAKLEGYEQLKQPGAHTIPSVPLEFRPPQTKLSLSRDQVTADLVVVASVVDYEIPYVIPVYIQTPATLTGYDVELDKSDFSIANLHVRGPQQGINALTDKSFPVKAVLNIEPTDAGKGEVSRVPVYSLPDGVTVTGADASHEVKFTLTRRD